MSSSPIHHLIDKRSDDSQNITVVCRVRPVNQRESNLGAGTARANCVTVPSSMDGPKAIVINTKPEPKTYTFDYVADEHTSQEKMFQVVGIPVTHTCLEGYNGTIICYGQTGSGKSFTTFGGSDATAASTTGTSNKGLVPRVLEYIWQHIEGASKPQADSPLQTTYTCSCSFYEIYQEKVYDLLDSATAAAGNGSNSNNTNGNSLQVREDSKAGVYVEGLTEEFVSSPADANRVLALGHNNRHVGATAMNRESSRSHAVFLLVIRSVETNNDTNTKRNCVAKFSLVDLAGSERHKDTAASGERLKEASQINKSLSTLGNVIKALADRSTTAFSSASAASHFFIPYRDSKLTFLLRDSLGGNSKTVLVATVSPADSSVAETLSTLQFAQRAKCIKNVVVCNEETSGNVLALQKEIAILREKLAASGANGSSTFNNAARNFTLNTMCATPMAKQTRSRLSFGSPSEREPAVPAEPLSPTSQLRHSLVQLSSFFTNAAGDAAHTGGSSADNMLFKALNQRCQHLDESNGTLRSSLADMQGRVDQQEKVAMGMKMKLKMRETEISRLKSKTTGGDASDASGAAAAEAEVAQRIKVEVDAVRDELQGELIKHRMEIQEMRGNRDSFFQHLGEVAAGSDSDNASIRDSLVKLIEQYNASTTKNAANIAVAGSNKSTSLLGAASSAGTGSVSNGYWSGPAEVKFQHDLLQRIATAEQTQSSLQSTMQMLIEQDFKKLTAVGADEDDAGVSVAEAKAFRRENRDLQRKIEAAEAEKTKYQNAIQLIRTRSEAAETKFAESKKELESKCSTFEQQNVEFSCQVANLTKDCAALSEKLANTQNGLVQSEKEAQDAIDKKEAAYRSEILQLRKDNSLLFQKYNELRDEHMRVLGVVSEMEGKVGELEEELSYTRSCADKDAEESSVVIDGLNGKIEALNARIKTMEAEAHQHEATIAEYKESIAAAQDAVFNLQEANRGLEVAAMTAAKNFNKLQFEFDNLQEDTDNLYTQQETLLSQHGESSAIIAENTAEIAKKAEEISQLQAILAEKESEASANLLSIMQEKAALIESVKKLETKVMLLNDEKGQQYNDFVVANTCLKSVSQSYATAKEQVAEVTNELNEVQSAMAGKDEEITQLRAQCEENKASGAASEEATAKIEALTAANAELASSNTALQAQISSIVGAINQASLTPSDGDASTASGDEITSSLDSFRRSIEGEFQAKLDNMASQHAEELKDAASTHQLFVDNIMEQQAQALADAEAAAKIQGASMAQSRIAEETATENVQLKEKLEEMSAQMQALQQEQSSATDKLKAENKLQAASIVAFKQQVAELNTKQTELAEQNAKLIGHTNTKQKIQLMQEYKAQLAEQDATIAALREQVSSLMSGCWDKGKEDDAVVVSGASAGVKSGSSSVTNAYVEALNAKKAAAAAVASSRARATALADRTNAHHSGQH